MRSLVEVLVLVVLVVFVVTVLAAQSMVTVVVPLAMHAAIACGMPRNGTVSRAEDASSALLRGDRYADSSFTSYPKLSNESNHLANLHGTAETVLFWAGLDLD
ncbi:hypothetical protein [Bradyrhizobium liaoningense]|uniref:hypothetical protein n=1 Tax=Bradyrhizobium liaoningense TaxID=43992 RepID=UPI001BAB0600|nr:hypothetical protein [Bradyrhizobium liaoningense]MBR0715181.1 hypothetical protein [Bradyrhizobium liaoningense]